MSRRWLWLVLLLCTPVAPARAARCTGTISNAYTAQERAIRVLRARVDPVTNRLTGALRGCGRNCPLRGAMVASCTAADGPSALRDCAGSSGAAACRFEGSLYRTGGRTHFEGTYDCAGNPVGALSLRCRRAP